MQKTGTYAEFAVHIRNKTPSAVRVQVPFGVVEVQTSPVRSRTTEPVAHADLEDEAGSEIDHGFESSDFDPSKPTSL
jgi:hypothetical protein